MSNSKKHTIEELFQLASAPLTDEQIVDARLKTGQVGKPGLYKAFDNFMADYGLAPGEDLIQQWVIYFLYKDSQYYVNERLGPFPFMRIMRKKLRRVKPGGDLTWTHYRINMQKFTDTIGEVPQHIYEKAEEYRQRWEWYRRLRYPQSKGEKIKISEEVRQEKDEAKSKALKEARKAYFKKEETDSKKTSS